MKRFEGAAEQSEKIIENFNNVDAIMNRNRAQISGLDAQLKAINKDLTNIKSVQLAKYASKKDLDFMQLKLQKKVDASTYDELM
jgi:hypothetical protein